MHRRSDSPPGVKRKRDLEKDTGLAESSSKQRITDSHYVASKRMDATQTALDVLLEPNNRQTPREQKVYQQSIEELKRLNTGDYAINAQNDEELALSAARRAHLKALTFPGDFSDKQKNDWKPGGKWAQCAETAEKYEQQVDRAERKRQRLEKECPIATLNKAVNSSELKNAISTYKEESQQDKRKYCQILKAKLGTIRDYLEGKQIGIAKADFAWNEIKDEQKKPEFIAIVDLRQLLNLPHQETTSSFPDQGSHALKIPETVPPHQLQDVEMKSPDNNFAQQHFEQSRQDAKDMLKALPNNEFKATSQARYNIITKPDTTTPSQLQDVSIQMKNLHNDLAQQHFRQSRQDAEGILKVLPTDEFKTTSQATYDDLIKTYTTMTPDTTTPSQLQEFYTQMTTLHTNLIQRHLEYRGYLKGIATPDFPETFQNRFKDLQQTYQSATDFGQRRDVYHQIVAFHMEVLQLNFQKYRPLIQKIRPNIQEIAYDEFEKLVWEHKEMPYEDKIPRNKQQMVDLHDRMMHFHQEQARFLFEMPQPYVEGILRDCPEVPFQATNQEKYNALIKIELQEVPSYQLQEALDNMIALHHDLTRWSFQKSKADIEILLDLPQQDHVRTQFQLQESAWNTLESERNNRVHLDGELRIIDELLKIEHSLIQRFYKQQTKASIDDLLSQFNSSEFKIQFKDLKSEYQNLASSWSARESEWENLKLEEDKRDNLGKRHTTLDELLKYHNRLANTIYQQTQSRIQQLQPMLAENEFKQTSQTRYTNLIEQRPQGNIAIDNLQERARSSQTWQRAVADLLDLHSDLAQEAIKQTHAFAQQLLREYEKEPLADLQKIFEDLTKRCREDLFTPDSRHPSLDPISEDDSVSKDITSRSSPFDDRPIEDWEKNEKNTEARANDWQGVVKDLLDVHYKLTNRIYQWYQTTSQSLFQHQANDLARKKQFQEDFDALNAEYRTSTNPGQRQHILERMNNLLTDLYPWTFQEVRHNIQHRLDYGIKDRQYKTEYQEQLSTLQAPYQSSSSPDWRPSLKKITDLQNTVVDYNWKEEFQQLQARIDHLLQGLQEDVVEDQYRKTYAQLKQTYEELSQGGQKLGTTPDTAHCYNRMALFYKDLLGVSEMNRRHYEMRDDTKEMEHYANELEKRLQRHMGRVHQVWTAENGQGQSITYAKFTDLEGKEHPEEVVEVVDGTDTKTQKAVQGYYCPTTRHFISSDHWTIYDAQLTSDQQLRLKDTRETPWEHQLRRWEKPADTKARLALEEAKQKIWKVLSRDAPAFLELSLGFHGSYLSKTTIAGSDADIHIAFNNSPINNQFHNDLPKYREIMNNALIEAFTKQHVKIWETVTTINEKAFGTEVDVFPAFHYRSDKGHRGLISFTSNKWIVTHFLEQKRQNTQKKSERTFYRSRSVVRIIKYLRDKVSKSRETIPSFIIEALVYNTPDEHFVDSTPEGKPIKRDLAATLDHVLAYCIDHTATDEACKEWKEVDGIKYLFNLDANTPWDMELQGEKYTYTGKHNIPREQVHEFLQQLQEYIKTQQEGQFQSIQLSRPLVGTSSS